MPIVEMIKEESEASPETIMAALITLAQGDEPLLLKESDRPNLEARPQRGEKGDRGDRRDNRGNKRGEQRERRSSKPAEAGMQRLPYRSWP